MILFIVSALALLFFLFVDEIGFLKRPIYFTARPRSRPRQALVEPAVVVPPQPEEAAAPTPEVNPDADHDFTVIDGIGPKADGLLREAGITTFAALAESSPERITDILTEGGFRAPFDPTTWPEQAAYAAQSDWEGLAEFQSELIGGRRVE